MRALNVYVFVSSWATLRRLLEAFARALVRTPARTGGAATRIASCCKGTDAVVDFARAAAAAGRGVFARAAGTSCRGAFACAGSVACRGAFAGAGSAACRGVCACANRTVACAGLGAGRAGNWAGSGSSIALGTVTFDIATAHSIAMLAPIVGLNLLSVYSIAR